MEKKRRRGAFIREQSRRQLHPSGVSLASRLLQSLLAASLVLLISFFFHPPPLLKTISRSLSPAGPDGLAVKPSGLSGEMTEFCFR